VIIQRLLCTALISLGLASASTITIPNNGGSVFFQETSGDNPGTTRSLGQTFTVPAPTAQNILTGFDFFLTQSTDNTFDYRGYIFQWDTANSRATGSALYQSSARNGTQAAFFSGLTLVLNPALTYVAFVTTQGVANNSFSGNLLFHNSADVYAGGAAFQQVATPGGNSGTGTWTTAAWTGVNGNTDFQFNAVFIGATAPEPGTLAMGALAATAFALSRLRRGK